MTETTDIMISLANSIRFAHINGLMPSFDNTLTCHEEFLNTTIYGYSQIFFEDDDVPLQIKAGLDATVAVKIINAITGDEETLTIAETTVYDEFKIIDYLINFDTIGTFYITADSETSSYVSEAIEIIEEDSDYKKVEWFNLDPTSNINNWQFDYTTATAIANVNFARLIAVFKVYNAEIDSTVVDNQTRKTKIRETQYRGLKFNSIVMPRWMAEKLTIASGHDKFIINDVEFVREEDPELVDGEFTNTVEWTANLTQKNVIGFNTHNVGFDCDEITMYRVQPKGQEDATGSGSFSVTAGFGVTSIIAKWTFGTPVLKVGSSIGGEEIFSSEQIVNASPPLTENVRFAPSTSEAWTIYWEVEGGTIDLYVQTIMFNLEP